MKNAEVLDRALAGKAPATPAVDDLVRLAQELEQTWTAVPSSRAAKRGLAQALDAFSGNGQVVELRPGLSRGRRFAASAAVAVAAMVAIPGFARAASSAALPGDVLYPVKLGFEGVRVVLAEDAAGEAEVYLALSDVRLEEAVLARGLHRPDSEVEALRRYTGSVNDFSGRLQRARALGLDIAVLVSQSQVLLEQQNEILAALLAQPADPSVPGIQRAIEALQRAKGKARRAEAAAQPGAHGRQRAEEAKAKDKGKDERDHGQPESPGKSEEAPGKQDDPPGREDDDRDDKDGGGQGPPEGKGNPNQSSVPEDSDDDDDGEDAEQDLLPVPALEAQSRSNPGLGRGPKWNLIHRYLFRTRI
jgi:hypothetical protein